MDMFSGEMMHILGIAVILILGIPLAVSIVTVFFEKFRIDAPEDD